MTLKIFTNLLKGKYCFRDTIEVYMIEKFMFVMESKVVSGA